MTLPAILRHAIAAGSLLLLAGCGDREGSIEAALALADAVYPGQLEFREAHLQKDSYDITLAVRGDPVTRIRFSIDRDPSDCRPGTRCEERLRAAYATGIAAGIKLKAVDQAFRDCGIRTLGVHDSHITVAFTTIIEVALDPARPQPGLDRLAPCVTAFRAAVPADASGEMRSLSLRILLAEEEDGQSPDALLTFETRLPSNRTGEVNYLTTVTPEEDSVSAARLRLNPNFLSGSALRDMLAEAARDALADDPEGGHVPEMSFLWETRLDPQRLDVFRTYMLACSDYTFGEGPCDTDIAVAMRYDLSTEEISEISILRGILDDQGVLNLPDLPGR